MTTPAVSERSEQSVRSHSSNANRVIVVGDVHLGAQNSNVTEFELFLKDLYQSCDSIDELILLGDLWDMVRRDPFGVAWETSTTLDLIKQLAMTLPVRYILGNHDLYLKQLDASRYEADFYDHYVLNQDGTSILFKHGHEFDGFHSMRLSEYLSGAGDRGEIDPTRGRKDPIVAGARSAIGNIKRRLRTDGGHPQTRAYPRRERRAHGFLQSVDADKLVYGHTHAPYVHHDNLVANAGSWKSTAPINNTYVEIKNGQLSLYQYRPNEEDTRIE